jgi:hypothetical protein
VKYEGLFQWWAAALALVALFAGAGCGNGEGDAVGGVTPRPTEGEIADFVDRYCKLIEDCCAKLGQTQLTNHCHDQLYGIAIPGPVQNYDPVAGKACLAELEAPTAAGGSCLPMSSDPDDACWHVFQGHYGTTPAGGTCAHDSDCAAPPTGTSVCTTVTGGGATRFCMWHQVGKAGDHPCVGDQGSSGDVLFSGDLSQAQGYICRSTDGLFCDGPTDTCLPRGAPGATCLNDVGCAAHICQGGVCVAASKVGAPCGQRCEDGSFCSMDVCVPSTPAGSPCAQNEECALELCANGVCAAIEPVQRSTLFLGCSL